MRRADRLFQTVQLIRGRRLSTAAFLASRLEVSVRTVYRDIADLQRQGVPIDGEAGVGYRLGRGFDLPPLMFGREEAQALVAAARIAQAWLDPALARAADSAVGKMLSVLPASDRAAAEALALYAPVVAQAEGVRERLQVLREAAQSRRKVALHYRDPTGRSSHRTVWPLGCFFWGSVWTLAAWCETRSAFRAFRIDRIDTAEVLAMRFDDLPGRTLADLLRQVRAERRATGALTPAEPA